jgi:hypothetical protein
LAGIEPGGQGTVEGDRTLLVRHDIHKAGIVVVVAQGGIRVEIPDYGRIGDRLDQAAPPPLRRQPRLSFARIILHVGAGHYKRNRQPTICALANFAHAL